MLGCSHFDKLTYYFINCVSNYDVSIEWRTHNTDIDRNCFMGLPEVTWGRQGIGASNTKLHYCQHNHEFMKNDKKNKYIDKIIYCGSGPEVLYLMKKIVKLWLNF